MDLNFIAHDAVKRVRIAINQRLASILYYKETTETSCKK
jgi:hypothetical protein